ncbi:uncharacterized mitochondrial protein AtMg00810-like [Solanum verrucosum]|uniref:uncharacterized mitochondrial protein AtMg00810-like n=1 Tax=Solanum verrucosum TaxID=315347 RepID=UPI0020D01BE4|nr:uncharacterized mitochondrial protein AtMg00810-like [Solanum verrucosum]
MKDLGELRYFLAIEFARSKEGILMHQRKSALELISETGLGAAKPAMPPMDINVKFTNKEYDDHVFNDTNQAEPIVDQGSYQRLIRKLLYVTVTRPYISFCFQNLSQYLQAPKKSHMEEALRIVKYLKKQQDQGVLLSSNKNNVIAAYCDADWVACPNSRKSVTSYAIKMGYSLIIWKSKKQTTVFKSSAEAEYRSLASTMAKIVWIVELIKELGIDVTLMSRCIVIVRLQYK